MIQGSRLLREAARCIQAGPSLASKWRRFHYAPLSLWLRHPRRAALFVAVRPYTMLPYARLANLYEVVTRCIQEDILGNFVECGVWRGGSGAVLASIAYRRRGVWLFDSFQGCPLPGPEDVSCHGRPGEAGEASAPLRDVVALLHALDLERGWTTIRKGWFADTLPKAKDAIGQIALLHLDCDWYDSVRTCLEELYPQVVSGGFIVVDDFGYWPSVQRAVEEYFWGWGVPLPKVEWVDHTGVFLRKP